MTQHLEVDVAVVGSGFAGSLAALALARRGRTVALIERGRHPRFAIGESSTPLANLLLEEFADRYDLPQVRALSKWGSWQRARPDISVGLKRGFSFFFHRPGHAFDDDENHARQLLVAASPHDAIGDTHWYRPDFDHHLVREAEAAGAIYLDETELDQLDDGPLRTTIAGTRRGQPLRIAASFVVDASGPRGFLQRALGLGTAELKWMPPTHGLYTHFEQIDRWQDETFATAPFPVDDAALHHVFPGGWIWVLRFNNGITSAGAAFTDPIAAEIQPADGAAAWQRLLASLPSVGKQFAHARALLPFVHAPRLAFRTSSIAGARWALLPSAAGVIDPLLSTGFPLTLLGLLRLLDILESTKDGPERTDRLVEYSRITHDELDATEQLVAALYAVINDAELFKRLTLLYFAAASYSEAARRLGRSHLAAGFLLHKDPRFGPALVACTAAATAVSTEGDRQALISRIDAAIEPFDTAGLGDRGRRDWYPVLADDLIRGATKLQATPAEIHQLLDRCGFVPTGSQPPGPADRR